MKFNNVNLFYLASYAACIADILLLPYCYKSIILATVTLLTTIVGVLFLRLLMRDLDERDHWLWDLLHIALIACFVCRLIQ